MKIENCYDFPLAVLHRSSGDCPRYAGGTCRPLPTPTQPYSIDEAVAVEAYEALVSGELAANSQLEPIEASGRSEVDGEVVVESDLVQKALLVAGAHAGPVRRKDDA